MVLMISNMFQKQRRTFDNKIPRFTGFSYDFGKKWWQYPSLTRGKNEIFTNFSPKFGRIFIKLPKKSTFYYLVTVNKHYWPYHSVWNHSVCCVIRTDKIGQKWPKFEIYVLRYFDVIIAKHRCKSSELSQITLIWFWLTNFTRLMYRKPYVEKRDFDKGLSNVLLMTS